MALTESRHGWGTSGQERIRRGLGDWVAGPVWSLLNVPTVSQRLVPLESLASSRRLPLTALIAKLQTLRHKSRISQVIREFYRGWKHKLGVATLVMACFVAPAWLRGLSTFDRVCFGGRNSYITFRFSNPRFGDELGVLMTHRHLSGAKSWTGWTSNTRQDAPSTRPNELGTNGDATEADVPKTHAERRAHDFWRLQWHGFLIGGTDYCWQVAASYKSIVLPPTALSAWRMLSKPRRSAKVPE